MCEVNPSAIVLREPVPGDLGWIVHRQGVIYAEEYGWNNAYEGMVAGIIAEFRAGFDPARDAAWIAELDASVVGSVFLVHTDDPTIAKLRLLYVDHAARGLGLGTKLVDVCITRARANGYDELHLWTASVLAAARHVYLRGGFRMIDETPYRAFGKDLLTQNWRLKL